MECCMQNTQDAAFKGLLLRTVIINIHYETRCTLQGVSPFLSILHQNVQLIAHMVSKIVT